MGQRRPWAANTSERSVLHGGCRVATQFIYREESRMLFVTTYKIKPYISNEETKELLQVFAEAGPGPGTTAHYVAADGSHGVVVAETDDIAGAYRNLQNYTQWVEYDTNVMLPVEEAVPLIMDALS